MKFRQTLIIDQNSKQKNAIKDSMITIEIGEGIEFSCLKSGLQEILTVSDSTNPVESIDLASLKEKTGLEPNSIIRDYVNSIEEPKEYDGLKEEK